MKKLLFVLCLSATMVLAGCSHDTPASSSKKSSSEASEEETSTVSEESVAESSEASEESTPASEESVAESSEASEESTPSTGGTYTITGNPNWVANDGAVVFAWAWSAAEGGDGHWYTVELGAPGSGGADALELTATFTAPEDRVGVCLARCPAGTTAPDWEVSGDNPGRIYNQTDDITVAGPGTYAAAGWKEYAGPTA